MKLKPKPLKLLNKCVQELLTILKSQEEGHTHLFQPQSRNIGEKFQTRIMRMKKHDKDKFEPGLFFDLVTDGAGPMTKAAKGAQNIRVKGWRLDIRKYSFGLRVGSRLGA